MQSPLIIMMETQATTYCCFEPFRWESLRGWDFRPQLIVVSGLFGGNPFVDGILGHNLLLAQAFSVGIPSWMGFRISRSPFFTNSSSFHNRILAIRKPVLKNFFFFTMEFWLSRSLSHEFFFFHDGILAIKEPFTRTFLFSRWNSGYQGEPFTQTVLFHDGIMAIKEPFT
jgi:hypothetical protein